MGIAIPQVLSEDKASGAQIVDGSLRFDRSKTHILKNTFSSAGNRKTWTLSFWHKITDTSNPYNIFTASRTSSTRPTFEVAHNYGSSGNLVLSQFNGSGYDIGVKVDGLYRDVGAWYHFVVVVDTTQSTDSNRVKAYVNGVQRTVTATAGGSVWPSLNADLEIGNNVLHNISANAFGDNNPMNGYVSNFYYINGQALDPSYFGYTDALTNTWRPKKYTGNLKAYTVPSGFSYWTGMNQNWNTGGSTSSGNDFINQALPSSGKVYWEVTLNSPATYRQIGIAQGASGTGTSYNDNIFGFYYNGNPPIWLTKNSSGTTRGNAVSHGSGTGTTWTSGDKLMFAWDADNDKIWFGLNGTWYASGNPATGSNPIISGEDLSANAHYFKQGRTDSENITTLTNITSGNASYFSNLDMVYDNRNTFYLPFDGNSPIGQDQSGNGNNWTPVNFGGSNTLEKATGALPILNTDGGGKVARVGVRTDSSASSLVLALPLVGIKSDFSNAINSGTSNKAITANGNATASSVQSNFYGGSFAFDGTGDYLTITNSSDFDFGSGNYTLEVWAYPTDVSTTRNILSRSYDGGTGSYSGFILSTANFLETTSQSSWDITISKTLIANTWQHLAVVRSGNTWTYYVNGVSSGTATVSGSVPTGPGDVQIGRRSGQGEFQGYMSDVRFYKGLAKYTQNFIPASTDPDILPDTPSGVSYSSNVALVPSTDGAVAFDGSGDYLTVANNGDFDFGSGDFTLECFVYPQNISREERILYLSSGTNQEFLLGSSSGDVFFAAYNSSGGNLGQPTTSSKLILNTWNHIAVVRNGATVSIYLNGVSNATANYSTNTIRSGETPLYIGHDPFTAGRNFTGFISNLQVIKGTALYTANFTPPSAPISSVANTKLLCCKSNSSATAFDVSPGTITANGNAAATNFNPFTVNINTQRGQESGYATLNTLDNPSSCTLSNGNLTFSYTATQSCTRTILAIAPGTGKYYWENYITTVGAFTPGIADAATNKDTDYVGESAGSYGLFSISGSAYKYNNNSGSSISGTAYGNGDTVMIAYDSNTGKFYGGCNGLWYNGSDPVAGTNPLYTTTSNTYFPAIGGGLAGACAGSINFGQKPFKFPPPAGFQPLALANTPRPTIVRPDQYVGIVTYTGTGAASRPVTNLGFKPDFVWIKNRSSGSYSHQLFDSVRGASAGCLYSDLTNAQDSNFPITSFDTSGFTLGSSASLASQSYASQNGSGSNYVGWAWKAGGNSNTYNINDVGYATASAAGLTAGTITPTGASVNTKSGFSIITYTGNGTSGATVSHGLGNTPGLLIVKRRSSTGSTANWAVWHSSLTAGYNLFLNSNDNAQAYSPSRFTSTIPTSTVFSLGSGDETNYSGGTFVSYLWTEIPGFSKFGSVTLSASSNDSFIWTGFRPRWFLLKGTGSTSNWIILDSIRDPFNFVDNELFANLSDTENAATSTYSFDFLSNGVKCRNQGLTGGFIYAAFAETPSFNLYGGQSNAR